jgi:hypothetical protein
VLFEKGRAIATDGHRLVMLPCPTNGKALLVDSRYLSAAIAAQREMHPPRPHEITIAPVDAGTVTIGIATGVSLVVPFRNPGQFPPYEQVVPKVDPKAVSPDGIYFDPRYLAAIAEVNDAIAPDSKRGVRAIAWPRADKNGELLDSMMFEGHNGALFVIMPMRAA